MVRVRVGVRVRVRVRVVVTPIYRFIEEEVSTKREN